MSTTVARPARPHALVERPRRRLPASRLVCIYVALLTLIPASLVVPQVGAAGTPATIFGIFLLVWWMCVALSGGLAKGARMSPVRLALALVALSVLLSWAAGVAVGWVRPADIHEVTDGVYSLLPVTVTELQDKSQLAGMRGLLSAAGSLGVALVLCDGVRTWRDFDRVVTAVVWLAATIGLVGVIQFVTGDNLASHVRIPGLVASSDIGAIVRSGLNRVQATAIHPIEYGVVLAALFPLALHHALYRVRRWYDYVPVALLALAVPMSVSRSGILVLAVSLIVLFKGWSWNRRAWTIVLLPVVVVAMRGAFPGLIGTIRSLFTSVLYDPSVSGRTSDYGTIFGIYADHPWLGRGSATFMPAYYRTLDNQYLMNLVEIGAIGLAITLFLFLASNYAARYARRHALSPAHQHVGLCLSAGILGMAASYATFDAWGFPMAAGTTFLLVGLAGCAWRLSDDDLVRTEARRSRDDAAPVEAQ